MQTTSQRWITVFNGPVWRSLAVQSRLEAEGFTTFVPDTNMRAIDPYITGGDVFALDVQVPEDQVASASKIVDAEFADSAEAERKQSETRRETRSQLAMAWWTIFVAPVGLVLGLAYLWRVRRAGIRPAMHGFNVMTIVAATVFTAAQIGVLCAALTH